MSSSLSASIWRFFTFFFKRALNCYGFQNHYSKATAYRLHRHPEKTTSPFLSAGIGRADELPRCLGMPPPGHGRCGLARLRLALGPGGNARDDRAGPARPSPTDEPTRLPDALGCLSLLKRKAPASGLQAAGCRRPIRFGPGLLILTDYDAVYAYHLREVRCARTHDPTGMREASAQGQATSPAGPGTTHRAPECRQFFPSEYP